MYARANTPHTLPPDIVSSREKFQIRGTEGNPEKLSVGSQAENFDDRTRQSAGEEAIVTPPNDPSGPGDPDDRDDPFGSNGDDDGDDPPPPRGSLPSSDGMDGPGGLLDVQHAEVATINISVKALRLGSRQMTQSGFRQLNDETVLDPTGLALIGRVLGYGNYWWAGCHAPIGDHKHLLWQKHTGTDGLRRCAVYRDRSAAGGAEAERSQRLHLEAIMDTLATLAYGIGASRGRWRPRSAPQAREYEDVDVRGLVYRPRVYYTRRPQVRRSDPEYDRYGRFDRPPNPADLTDRSPLATYLNVLLAGSEDGWRQADPKRMRKVEAQDLADLARFLADSLVGNRGLFAWPARAGAVTPTDVGGGLQADQADEDTLDFLARHLDLFPPHLRQALVAYDAQRSESLAESQHRDQLWATAYDRLADLEHLFIAV
jgi:hypothetical protein